LIRILLRHGIPSSEKPMPLPHSRSSRRRVLLCSNSATIARPHGSCRSLQRQKHSVAVYPMT
jgi:hypothetical protein